MHADTQICGATRHTHSHCVVLYRVLSHLVSHRVEPFFLLIVHSPKLHWWSFASTPTLLSKHPLLFFLIPFVRSWLTFVHQHTIYCWLHYLLFRKTATTTPPSKPREKRRAVPRPSCKSTINFSGSMPASLYYILVPVRLAIFNRIVLNARQQSMLQFFYFSNHTPP